MNKYSLFSLMYVLWMFSCSSSTQEQGYDEVELSPEQQQVKDLEAIVLEIHDEVMPLMATLVSLKSQLEANNIILSSSNQSEAYDQVIINDLVVTSLDQAHEGMMNWMRNFHPIEQDFDTENNLIYLKKEREKIEYVQNLVNNSIKSAEEVLGNGGTVEQ